MFGFRYPLLKRISKKSISIYNILHHTPYTLESKKISLQWALNVIKYHNIMNEHRETCLNFLSALIT